jgi:regulator of protease activity HflC (stomatin/prohibitin superfamily)
MGGQAVAALGIFFVGFIVFIVFAAALMIRIIKPYERGIVERLGKYQKTVESGMTVILPFGIDSIQKVDMREMVLDVPPQEVITKDNVVVTVDAVVYTEVTDPVRVKYNVENFYLATIKLAQTNLRNVVGDMSLDESLTSRENINVKLRNILDEATDKWGVRVTRVELQRIEPPADVTISMHRQMKAERERRAMILEADGMRESAIKKSEGIKQSQILEAEGKSQAIRIRADADQYEKLTVAIGEAQAIETVFGAIHNGDPTDDLIAIKYLEALQGIANGQATKIFMPLDSTALMGSLGTMAELFKDRMGQGPTRGHKGYKPPAAPSVKPGPGVPQDKPADTPIFDPQYPDLNLPPDQLA